MKTVNELALLILFLLMALFTIHLVEGSGWSWIRSKFFTNYQDFQTQTGGGQTGQIKSGADTTVAQPSNPLSGAAHPQICFGKFCIPLPF